MKPKKFSLLIPPDLHARCVEAAKADHRSLNSYILRVLDRYAVEPDMVKIDEWHGVYPPMTVYPIPEEKIHS